MTDAPPPAAAGAEEPSIEEILASIRKIISDEPVPEGDAAAAPDLPMPEKAAEPVEEGEDVLDLSAYAETPAHDIENSSPPLEPEHAAFDSNFDLGLEDSDNADSTESDMDISSIMAASEFIPSPLPGAADSLISPAIADAATAAFARLNQAADSMPAPAATQLWVGARTIEQVVEDLMRPMLRTWLDQNLPRLVERLVEKELARMARRAAD